MDVTHTIPVSDRPAATVPAGALPPFAPQASPVASGYLRQPPRPHPQAAKEDVSGAAPDEVTLLITYLISTRERARNIRENAPAGSYLDGALERTIEGLDQEIAALRYLLANRDHAPLPVSRRMRPAR